MVAARRPPFLYSPTSPRRLCSFFRLLSGSVENNKIMQIIQLLDTRKAKYNYAHTASVSECECASMLDRARQQQRQLAKIISA